VAVFKHHVRALSHTDADRDFSLMQDARIRANACMQLLCIILFFFSVHACMQMLSVMREHVQYLITCKRPYHAAGMQTRLDID